MQIALTNNNLKDGIDMAVAIARTTYRDHLPNYSATSIANDNNINILLDILRSGHHSVLQHINITLNISGISKLLTMLVLHNHPFYTSTQTSQSFTELDINMDCVQGYNKYKEYLLKAKDTYATLLSTQPPSGLNRFQNKKFKVALRNIARYVLPIGLHTNVVHTINLTTYLRYIVIAKNISELGDEGELFSLLLQDELINIDSRYSILIDYVLTQNKHTNKFIIFNKQNIIKGSVSLSAIPSIETITRIKTAETNTLDLHTHLPITDIMYKTGFKLTSVAFAQLQRHRANTILLSEYLQPDYSIIKDFITNLTHLSNDDKIRLISLVDELIVITPTIDNNNLHVAPSAIVFTGNISGYITALSHDAKLRLCHTAQPEIRKFYQIVKSIAPTQLTELMNPPCVYRYKNDITPFCTEGKRFCGVKVWKE